MRKDEHRILTASRLWEVVFAVTSVIALTWVVGTATFLIDVEETRFVAHANGFGIEHYCPTGYLTAGYLATNGEENIYDRSHYRNAEFKTPIHDEVDGILTVDAYHYPPPFLTLPYVMHTVLGNLFLVRTAWFILTLALLIGAVFVVVHWCGAFHGQKRLLVFPLLLCAPTLHIALQMGNAHIIVIAISMLAMVAFEKKQMVVGGTLLGFAVAAKIWPGVLVVYFLLQKRWKPASYSAIAVTAYSLIALLIFGLDPFRAFIVYEIPRISNGEAFPIMSQVPLAIMSNMSVFGIPHKLYALELISAKPALISPMISWTLTGLIGVLVVVIGLRNHIACTHDYSNRLANAQMWLALLTLVQLRSPFLPWPYGTISTLWLLILLSASVRGWKLGAILFAFLYLSINIPPDFLSASPNFHVGYTLLGSLFVFGATAAGLRQFITRSRQLNSPNIVRRSKH